jgi:hypothetical protein
MRKTKDILEIVLFIVAITFILSATLAIATVFIHISAIQFMIITVTILAVILAIICEFKEKDTECNRKENQLYENQINREIVYFLHAYYPHKFHYSTLTDDDWSLYSLLTNILSGAVEFTAFYNEALSKKFAEGLEELQMTHTKIYKQLKENIEKRRD